MTQIVVTGASSFVGSRFVAEAISDGYEVISLERLGIRNSQFANIKRLHHDILAEFPDSIVKHVREAKYLVHFAAAVAGANSILHPESTVTTNVVGTFNVLELARKMGALEKFVYISSGEALGPTEEKEALAEDATLHPSTPYAASKAAGEALLNSYEQSFKVPGMSVRLMNVFGPGQTPPRFIPRMLKQMFDRQEVICHVNNMGVPGSRNWMHVDIIAKQLLNLIKNYKTGEVYHLVGPEKTNLEVIRVLADALSLNPTVKQIVSGSTHEHRYALKNTKIETDLCSCIDRDLISTAHWYHRNREVLA